MGSLRRKGMVMMTVTHSSREMAQYLGMKVERWKRHTRMFLPEPWMRQKGVGRVFSKHEAFIVFMGGQFLAVGCGAKKAKAMVNELRRGKTVLFDFTAASDRIEMFTIDVGKVWSQFCEKWRFMGGPDEMA